MQETGALDYAEKKSTSIARTFNHLVGLIASLQESSKQL